MKKADGNISKEEMSRILQKRNQEDICYTYGPKRSGKVLLQKSVIKKDYNYKCPPKLGAITPICNKDLCKFRKLGIGSQVPDLIDDFEDIEFTRSPTSIEYAFTFQGEKIVINPEDMKDEKSFRVKLLKYGIYWVTLPRPRSGPSPFEMLMAALVKKAVENDKMKFEDSVEEQKYTFLKKLL